MGNLLNVVSNHIPSETQPSDPNPQQGLFQFEDVYFDSRFDSGNLMHVDQVSPDWYNVWICPDCYKTPNQLKTTAWFYFKVGGVKINSKNGRTIKFTIKNLQKNKIAMFKRGMVPVYCANSTNREWQYLPYPLEIYKLVNDKTQITFTYQFSNQDSEDTYFAFTFPYTYSTCQNFCQKLETAFAGDKDIYVHRELVNLSQDGRRIDLLTITSYDAEVIENPETAAIKEDYIENLFPEGDAKYRPIKFSNKQYILFSGRVHAGETHGSYMLESFIVNLLNKNDPVSRNLLKNFVFVIIPMLNPDGVYRGFHRMDPKGENWNLVYHKLDPRDQSGPYAAMYVAKSLIGRLCFYIDFHSHCNKHSGFTFNNYNPDLTQKTEIRSFVTLIDIYSKHFDINSCGFANTPKIKNKPGVSKSEIYRATGILHSYTLECGYHVGMKDPDRYNLELNPKQDMKRTLRHVLGIPEYRDIGNGVRLALADYFGLNNDSLLPQTRFKDLNGLKSSIYNFLSNPGNSIEEDDDEDEN